MHLLRWDHRCLSVNLAKRWHNRSPRLSSSTWIKIRTRCARTARVCRAVDPGKTVVDGPGRGYGVWKVLDLYWSSQAHSNKPLSTELLRKASFFPFERLRERAAMLSDYFFFLARQSLRGPDITTHHVAHRSPLRPQQPWPMSKSRRTTLVHSLFP